ncbi:MAG: WecB/TagA/CpsF family glycosyltransferase [Polyangiales bacterium]
MGRARMVHFVHPHALNLAAFDADYAALLADADIILPDGVGLRIAAKMLGVALEHNVNGTDLLPLLCARATASARPLILIGGAEGVASACADALVRSHPGLRVPFTSHGFLDAAGIARVEEAVRAHAPCVVLVGMGSPLQERWAWEHLASIPRITVLTVGGLFDFFSGRIPRSPLVWRELGLEWLWRLRQEPTRLGRRYLLGNPLFLTLAAKQRLFGPNAADRTANDGPSPDDPTP